MNNAEFIKLQIKKCSKCGTCRAHCPVFEAMETEPFVARGKVQMAGAMIDGKLEMTPKLATLFSHCLLCKSCVVSCPNGVETDELVIKARSLIFEEKGLPWYKRFAFKWVLPFSRRVEYLALLLRMAKKLGLISFAQKTRLLDIFPGRLGDKQALLPPPAKRAFRKKYSQVNKPPINVPIRGHVAYFTGCMTNVMFPEIGESVIKVLTQSGIEVHIPDQVCCGIPAISSGDMITAKRMAEYNVKAFSGEYDAVIVDCGSCGTALMRYPDIYNNDRSVEIAKKVKDISSYLVEMGYKLPQETTVQTEYASKTLVTYHDSCHLKKGMMVDSAPRLILKSLPGYEYVEMKESDKCCGAAGTYVFTHYDTSQKIASMKRKNIKETGADVITASCPSCIMQLTNLVREEPQVKACHPIELLARFYK